MTDPANIRSRDNEPDHKTDAQCPAALSGEPRQLVAYYIEGAAWQDIRHRVEMPGYRRRNFGAIGSIAAGIKNLF